MILKNRLSPAHHLISLAQKRHFMASDSFSSRAFTNMLSMSCSGMFLLAPARKNISRIELRDVELVMAPLNVMESFCWRALKSDIWWLDNSINFISEDRRILWSWWNCSITLELVWFVVACGRFYFLRFLTFTYLLCYCIISFQTKHARLFRRVSISLTISLLAWRSSHLWPFLVRAWGAFPALCVFWAYL